MTMIVGLAAREFAVLAVDRMVRTTHPDGSVTHEPGRGKLRRVTDGWGTHSGITEAGRSAFAALGDQPPASSAAVERLRAGYDAYVRGSPEAADHLRRNGRDPSSTFVFIHESKLGPCLFTLDVPDGRPARGGAFTVTWPDGVPGVPGDLEQLVHDFIHRHCAPPEATVYDAIRACAQVLRLASRETSNISSAIDVGVLQRQRGGAHQTYSIEGLSAELANKADADLAPAPIVRQDTRGVISGARYWVQKKGVETGPFTMDRAGNVLTGTVDLLPKPHVVLVRGEILRNDGQPAIPFGPISADSDKAATVLSGVASPDGTGEANMLATFDTDTEIGAGNARYRVDAGSTTDLTVSEDRTAVWVVEQGEGAERFVEVQARNAGGEWGEWFPISVPIYVPPPEPTVFPPSIASVTLAVISINAGADDQYVVSISTNGTVAGSTHAFLIELYAGGALVHTETAHDPESGPLIQVETAAAPGTYYHARVRLYQLSDGAVFGDVTTIPKLRS